MSPDLERVIGRAVTNKEFRDELLADPEGAVNKAKLKLSKEEIADLKAGVARAKTKMTPEQIDQQLVLQSAWK